MTEKDLCLYPIWSFPCAKFVALSADSFLPCCAGCDILLMPSRFEPCGLNQLFAMRYGTIPIAHATGGLRDTIQDYSPYASGATHPLSACPLVGMTLFAEAFLMNKVIQKI